MKRPKFNSHLPDDHFLLDDNAALVRAGFTNERLKKHAEETHTYAEGDLIKASFQDDDAFFPNENMWVLIQSVDEDSITGILNNQPFGLPELKYGDIVKVPFTRILQHSPKK